MGCVQYDEARPFSQPPARNPQIGLVNLRNYALVRWRGMDLGIYNNRPIIGSSKPSIHRDGRTWDYRAPDRATLESFWEFCIYYADALNIQAIHDYARGRLWRTCQGWHSGNIGVGAGGAYTHVERNWEGARDARTITQIVGGEVPSKPVPAEVAEMWVIEGIVSAGTDSGAGDLLIGLPWDRKSCRVDFWLDCPHGEGANLWGAQAYEGGAESIGLWAGGKQWELWLPGRQRTNTSTVIPSTIQAIHVQNKGPRGPVHVTVSGT